MANSYLFNFYSIHCVLNFLPFSLSPIESQTVYHVFCIVTRTEQRGPSQDQSQDPTVNCRFWRRRTDMTTIHVDWNFGIWASVAQSTPMRWHVKAFHYFDYFTHFANFKYFRFALKKCPWECIGDQREEIAKRYATSVLVTVSYCVRAGLPWPLRKNAGAEGQSVLMLDLHRSE